MTGSEAVFAFYAKGVVDLSLGLPRMRLPREPGPEGI